MPSHWSPKIVQNITAESVALKDMDYCQAQPYCNFVVLKPQHLLPGFSIENLSLRPEAPPGRPEGVAMKGRPSWGVQNRSAYRLEIKNLERCIRVKQFLYDWAPPACDHPCLWLSEVEPFLVGDDVGWLGTDYRQVRGASVTIGRTIVELSVYRGIFRDEELQHICCNLTPALPRVQNEILATPFAHLSYQSRHQDPIIQVPVGCFQYIRKPRDLKTSVFSAAQLPAHLPRPNLSEIVDYQLDSVFVYGEISHPQEIDFYCEHRNRQGHYLHLLVCPVNTENGIEYPPQLNEHPCKNEILRIAENKVHHAFITREYGPHEAVWQLGEWNYMLLSKPSLETDRDWFIALLEQIVNSPLRCTQA